jgi:hypothetical protein
MDENETYEYLEFDQEPVEEGHEICAEKSKRRQSEEVCQPPKKVRMTKKEVTEHVEIEPMKVVMTKCVIQTPLKRNLYHPDVERESGVDAVTQTTESLTEEDAIIDETYSEFSGVSKLDLIKMVHESRKTIADLKEKLGKIEKANADMVKSFEGVKKLLGSI